MSVWINVTLETRQTGDVLAGKDRRLCELVQTDRAKNAKPVDNTKRRINSACVCIHSDNKKRQVLTSALC